MDNFGGVEEEDAAPQLDPAENQFEGGAHENSDPVEDTMEYNDEDSTVWRKVVNRFPKATIWFWLALGMTAMRAATGFIITVAFFSIVTRLVQVVSVFVPKPYGQYVGMVGYGLTGFFHFIMFFSCLVKG